MAISSPYPPIEIENVVTLSEQFAKWQVIQLQHETQY